jgi:hypothetical protein
MFAGSVKLEELKREKPMWIVRLKEEGKLEKAVVQAPPTWFRVAYFIFGFLALSVGLYLLSIVLLYHNYME